MTSRLTSASPAFIVIGVILTLQLKNSILPLQLSPSAWQAYADLAKVYDKEGFHNLAVENWDKAISLKLKPKFKISFPRGTDFSAISVRGFQFAAAPIPDLAVLQDCRSNASNEDDFVSCAVSTAFPPNYRLTQKCQSANPDDFGAAGICSIGRSDLDKAYRQFGQVAQCVKENPDANVAEVATCVGAPSLTKINSIIWGALSRTKIVFLIWPSAPWGKI